MPAAPTSLPSLILHEDEHLLVICKPAGWNTHAPSPYAGEGVYDWLRHREPRWATLAIIHRLDKETSGVMVFAKTKEANRSLTAQFTEHSVAKKYLLVTDREVKRREFTVASHLSRAGEKYVSHPANAGGERAETRFRLLDETGGRTLVEAMPVTGRTHQIRVHAAASGFPILGDELYGGTPSPRVHLHAAELTLRHPATGQTVTFAAPPDFEADSRQRLRAAFIDPAQTTACRLIHGAADGSAGWYVDRLGDYVLVQSEHPPDVSAGAAGIRGGRGSYYKQLTHRVREKNLAAASPRLIAGEPAPDRFEIRENGLRFELSFSEGYSVGLFLDQRDNRRRFLTHHVAAGFPLFDGAPGGREVLNTFAYTCGFSVAAAQAGARVTSLDLSKKYLEWGRRNFALNGLDPAAHDFIYGDTFDWLRRLAKKGRTFDAVILDPPTFSQSKSGGLFRAEKDYGRLLTAALPVLKPRGVILASTNAAALAPEDFLHALDGSTRAAGRRILQQHYAPQPPDFPVTKAEPAYLKTVWLKLE
jgi:23S rRNA (cytosine1962-C5)-methyltransferase